MPESLTDVLIVIEAAAIFVIWGLGLYLLGVHDTEAAATTHTPSPEPAGARHAHSRTRKADIR